MRSSESSEIIILLFRSAGCSGSEQRKLPSKEKD